MCFDPEVMLDNDITLFYDKERNVMIDEGGFEIINIFHIISPNILYLFKTKKETMFVYSITGEPVELVYPNEDEDDEFEEDYGIEMVSLYYCEDEDVMVDDDDKVFRNIHRLISRERYTYLKRVGGTEYVRDYKPGVVYELVFPF